MGLFDFATDFLFGSPPDPPNPYEVAAAQGGTNRETALTEAALNRYNQTTPYGQLTWAQDPNDPLKWSQTTTLNPTDQATLEAQRATSSGLTSSIADALSRTQNTFKSGVNFSNLPALQGGPAGSAYTPELTSQAARNTAKAGNFFSNQLSNASANGPLSFSSAPAMPSADNATRKQVEDALYSRMTSRLDPSFNQQQAALESQLTNQGITPGSEAWKTALENFGRTRTDAYQTALDSSIAGGGDEMARQFGLGMDARKQGISELSTLHNQPLQDATTVGGLNVTAGNLFGQGINTDTATRNQTLQERQAGLGEQYDARNQVINELNALRTGAQVQSPQFNPETTGTNVANTNIGDMIYNSAGITANNYDIKTKQAADLMRGLASGVNAGM